MPLDIKDNSELLAKRRQEREKAEAEAEARLQEQIAEARRREYIRRRVLNGWDNK